MKQLISLCILLGFTQFLWSQEDNEWKPYIHLTGYINSVAEFTNAAKYKEAKSENAIGLSDAGLLMAYKPLEKLEIKTTLVYTHYIVNLQSLIVEANGTYKFNDYFKVGAGKFLTPLSPVNQYFYAPVNISGFLPMVVSHHELLPQSISGLQVSGEFGNKLTAGYNFTYGSYLTVGHPLTGMLALQGNEDVAPYEYAPKISGDERPYTYYMGGSARLYAAYDDILRLGLNYFDGARASHPYALNNTTEKSVKWLESKKYSVGVDMELKVNNFKINSEYWKGNNKTDDKIMNSNYSSYYAEMMYDFGKITPFFRYDYIDDLRTAYYFSYPDTKLFDITAKTTSIGGGVAFRPIYEILIKLDFRRLSFDYGENLLQVTEKSFNHGMISVVYSF